MPPPTEAPSRKPYVRVITDKRREQNRRAQKIYREKLKRRIEQLEEQAATTTVTTTITPQAEQNDDVVGLPHSAVHEPEPKQAPPLVTTTAPQIIDLTDAFTAAGDLALSQESVVGPLQFIIGSNGPRQATEAAPPSVPVPATDVDDASDDYGDMDMRGIWRLPHRPPPTDEYRRPPSPPSSRPISFALTTVSHQKLGQHSRPHWLPDPYINHLHLVGEANLNASFAIGLSIGISRSAYVNDHPSSFPSCYVRLNTQAASASTSPLPLDHTYNFWGSVMHITAALHDHLQEVKPPLRPSPSQMLKPHPSYLDCIVFPKFRDRAVAASADGVLTHSELFLDLMQGGLICWGSTAPSNSRQSKRRGMADQVAWSTRSWEARKWFLKKWAWLAGTEEEENGDPDGIWTSSRWWWAMRGEVDDESDEDDDHDHDEQENQ